MVLNFEFFGPHERVKMQLAQLVLLNEGFESNSESGFVSRQLIHAPQRIVSGLSLQFVHFHVHHLFLWGVLFLLVSLQL